MEEKKRGEVVILEDRNRVSKVHNGKGYVKRQVLNPRYVGLKWGERANTRKPCVKGANKNLKMRRQMVKKKPVKK